MRPVNYNDSNCESTSSDCVIWTGRSLECVNLCNGDTVTNAIFEVANKLCLILDQLNISNYELSCISTTGGVPADFKSFINLLIAKVCSIPTSGSSDSNSSKITTESLSSGSDCPDCTVPLAPYFQYTDPSTGDTVTKDQVQNYVQKVGLTVGSMVNQITTLQQTNTSIAGRVQKLENTPVLTYSLPNLYPTGIASPTVALPLDQFTSTLETQFVALRTATGNPTQIYNAITTPPSDFNEAKALGTTGGVMGTLSGWVQDPLSLADSVSNVWSTIKDLRSAVANIQSNINTACSGIAIDFSATLENKILKLFFNGTLPSNLTACQNQGSIFKVSDQSGNYFNTTIDIQHNINNASGVVVDLNSTSLNFADDLNVNSVFCFTDINTGTTCQNILQTVVNNNVNCPTLNVVPSVNSVGFNFTHISGSLTYSVQLFDNTETMIQSQNYGVSGPITIAGNFSSLTANSLYRIRLQMIVSSSNTKTCPLVDFNTLPSPCPAPNTATAIIQQ